MERQILSSNWQKYLQQKQQQQHDKVISIFISSDRTSNQEIN